MADKEITAEDLEGWYTPEQARRQAMASLGGGTTLTEATNAIWRRVTKGLIRAAAPSLVISTKGSAENTRIDQVTAVIDRDWPRMSLPLSDFWNGDAVFNLGSEYSGEGARVYNYFGLKLSRADVDRYFPASALASPSEAKGNLGGAPRKAFWDDLWIAIFAQLWNSKLKPVTQNDIEQAMLDWAERRGEKLGETTVKKPAQKLFKAYKTWV